MTTLSVGDLAQMFLLKRQSALAKQSITDRSTELTTGLAADKGAHVSGDFAPLASLQNSLAQLNGYAAVNGEAGGMADAMQIALDTIDKQATSASTVLLLAGNGGASTGLNVVGGQAEDAFRSAMSALNARYGERSLFSGQNTSNAAVSSADTVLSDIQTLTAGAQTVQDISDAVDTYFADGGTFDTTIYQGGAPMAPLKVGPDETAQLSVRATDPALKATLKALAMGSLLAHGALAGNATAQGQLAQKAGEALITAQSDRAELAAHLGTMQGRIGDADASNQAQVTSLKIAQSQMMSVDPYEATTQLQEAQTQLEQLYTITARMSRLSLVDYLT
jgi:flagellar hook-associated protein 3 FlgL